VIATLSLICLIGVFVAGHVLGVHTTFGVLMVGFFAIAQGVLIAAAQTRGFEGQRVVNMTKPWTWENVTMQIARLSLERHRMVGPERVYVQTAQGPKPITGLFTARINHELSIVLDTTETDADAEFNRLKQGVM